MTFLFGPGPITLQVSWVHRLFSIVFPNLRYPLEDSPTSPVPDGGIMYFLRNITLDYYEWTVYS